MEAKIDTAITKKTISQLGIHLHTLEMYERAAVSLRVAKKYLIHNYSMPTGHHSVATLRKLAMHSTRHSR